MNSKIVNKDFNAICESEGIEGTDIVLGWYEEYLTFDEWANRVLLTYLDLEQDLLKLKDYEAVMNNREKVIEKLLNILNVNIEIVLKEGNNYEVL